jgi:hypothetical protein
VAPCCFIPETIHPTRETHQIRNTSRSMSHVSSNCMLKKRHLIIRCDGSRPERWKGITTKRLDAIVDTCTQLETLNTRTWPIAIPPPPRGPATIQQKTPGFRVVESSPDGEHLMMLRRCRLPYGRGKTLQRRLEIPYLIRELWGSKYIELA